MRLCTSCNTLKEAAEFPSDPTHRRCKTCKSASSKKSYQRHKAAAVARAKRWRDANLDKARAKRRAWTKRNWDRIGPPRAAASKLRYHADLERHRAYARKKAREKRRADPTWTKRCYADNREKLQRRAREWARNHPEARKRNYYRDVEKSRKRGRADAKTRRARRRGVTVEKVDYDRIVARDKSRCHICRLKVLPADRHFDHVIPLAAGGAHTETNIAVSHARCNMRKGAKVTKLF